MDTPSTLSPQKKVTFEPPPPAPSPPAAAAPAINVFDYMVPDDSEPESSASGGLSNASGDDARDRSPSPEVGRGRSKPLAHTEGASATGQQDAAYIPTAYHYAYNQHQYPPGYTYPPPQQTPYPAPAYWYPQPPSQAPLQQPLLTPGHPQPGLPIEESRSESQKKRKRSPMDAVKTATRPNGSLQSGLTGGLHKLLTAQEEDAARAAEASPLSPKKRHKRSIDEASKALKSRHEDKSKDKDKKRTASHPAATSNALTTMENKERDLTSKRAQRSHHDEDARYDSELERKARGEPSTRKTLTYPRRKHKGASHSEFFLSLIDKDRHSVKGQSIWGALKMFHEGTTHGSSVDDEARRAEEKRLLKGLRCKINKNGEVVLFARPEAEAE